MADIILGGQCVLWGCDSPATIRNHCLSCYKKAMLRGDLKPIRFTVKSRKKGKCPRCKKFVLLVNTTGLCRLCHKSEQDKTPRARATHKAYMLAHKEDDRRRGREYWARHAERKNRERHDRRGQLTRTDTVAMRWRRPDWFYSDDAYQRIAWSFTFDKSFGLERED
jgi:hypothetical protein